jgi:hypothetical protein
MRKIWVFVFTLSILAVGLISEERIKLDIKTKVSEKFDLKGIKYGTMQQLEEEGYEILEFGEDFSVWLKDYNEEMAGRDRYNYQLRICITLPSAVTEKPVLVEQVIRGRFAADILTYQKDDDFTAYLGKLGNYFIASHRKHIWESLSDLEKIRAFQIGRKAAKEIHKMIRSYIRQLHRSH